MSKAKYYLDPDGHLLEVINGEHFIVATKMRPWEPWLSCFLKVDYESLEYLKEISEEEAVMILFQCEGSI